MDKMTRFIFADMNYDEFQDWADKNGQYVTITEQEVVWIPYGYYAVMLARPGVMSHSSVLVQPVVSKQLATQGDAWSDVNHHLQAHAISLSTSGSSFWREGVAADMLIWLGSKTQDSKIHENGSLAFTCLPRSGSRSDSNQGQDGL